MSLARIEFLILIVPRLPLSIVVRLYPFSSLLRRYINQNGYWRSLFLRDTGLLPQFPLIDDNGKNQSNTYQFLKRYYLELFNYPVLTRTYRNDHLEKRGSETQFPDIELFRGRPSLGLSGGLDLTWHLLFEFPEGLLIDNQWYDPPEPVKRVRFIENNCYLIGRSGRVYILRSFSRGNGSEMTEEFDQFEPLLLPGVPPVTDILAFEDELTQDDRHLLSVLVLAEGRLFRYLERISLVIIDQGRYELRSEPGDVVELTVPHPILQIMTGSYGGHALDVFGNIYTISADEYEPTTKEDDYPFYNKLIPWESEVEGTPILLWREDGDPYYVAIGDDGNWQVWPGGNSLDEERHLELNDEGVHLGRVVQIVKRNHHLYWYRSL